MALRGGDVWVGSIGDMWACTEPALMAHSSSPKYTVILGLYLIPIISIGTLTQCQNH